MGPLHPHGFVVHLHNSTSRVKLFQERMSLGEFIFHLDLVFIESPSH